LLHSLTPIDAEVNAMGSPTRLYRFFIDAGGVRWGVETRLLSEGADAIPFSFTFTSQRGEHRVLVGSPPEGLLWEEFGDGDWCVLLRLSRLVGAAPRNARLRYPVRRASGRS
jgi:hypothetical protein